MSNPNDPFKQPFQPPFPPQGPQQPPYPGQQPFPQPQYPPQSFPQPQQFPQPQYPGQPYGGQQYPGSFSPQYQSPVPPQKQKSWLFTCAIGCLGVGIFAVLLCGGGAWVLYRKLPDLAREAAVTAINDSQMSPQDKQIMIEQVDRIVGEYKANRLTMEQVQVILDEMQRSSVVMLMIFNSAYDRFIAQSELTLEEKAEGKLVLERVARGVVEGKISNERLQSVMNAISEDDGTGDASGRIFHDSLTTDEVKKFIADCKALADDAQIPNEPYQVDIAGEFRKAVDKALLKKPEAE